MARRRGPSAPGPRSGRAREPDLRHLDGDPARTPRRRTRSAPRRSCGRGSQFAVKRMLRLGIILVGIRLSFFDVVKLGAWGVPVVAMIIVVALVVTHAFARALGVSDNLGTLAAASTAICGVTAALSVGPVIEAEESEVAYTVANVTLFGLAAMLTYPYLAHALFGATLRVRSASSSARASTTRRRSWAPRSPTRRSSGTSAAFRRRDRHQADAQRLSRRRRAGARLPPRAPHGPRGRPQSTCASSSRSSSSAFSRWRSCARSATRRSLSGGRALGIWDAAAWQGVAKTVGETWGSAALGTAMAGVGLSTNLRALRRARRKALAVGGAVGGPRGGPRAYPRGRSSARACEAP